MVDQSDEQRADGDRGGLRDGQRRFEDRIGAALQVRRRAALKQRDRPDEDPRQAGAEDDRTGHHEGERRRRQEREAGCREGHPQRAATPFAGPRHEGRSRRPRGHRAGPLHGEQHAEEGGRAMQTVVHDGEQDRLAEPERHHRERAGGDQSAQDGRGPDMGDSGAELAAA